METAEGPAGSERLETMKSETNERQGFTVNTEQRLFFNVSCEVTFREPNLFLHSAHRRAVPLELEQTRRVALRKPISERGEKNLPRNSSLRTTGLICVRVWLASFPT